MDCIILAGGFGTRLKNIVSNVPKPLALIGNKPFLEILLNQLEKSAIVDRVIFSLGYKADMVIEFVTKRKNQFETVFIKENKPLGTGGAIQQCIKSVKSLNFFVMNGDSYLEINWKNFLQVHQKTLAYVTLACTKVLDVSRFGNIEIDHKKRITAFYEKENNLDSNLINGGIYCFKKGYLPYHSVGENFSVEIDLFPKLIGKSMYAYPTPGLFIDIGTINSYTQAQKKLKDL